MSHEGDIAAGTGTILLNLLTWSGVMEQMRVAQVVGTLLVTVATLIYVGYGIVGRHKKLKKFDDDGV